MEKSILVDGLVPLNKDGVCKLLKVLFIKGNLLIIKRVDTELLEWKNLIKIVLNKKYNNHEEQIILSYIIWVTGKVIIAINMESK